ncbi:Y-family DNA polymerase [Blastopirellula marina]|uniref:Nucleotidyltransferase n=1 Tax=Blastopirellula marina TaxID=124 RepID=A0A2S8FD91_9BACT|nr:DNA polymerase Y family protein [Blastopirellula marina]PQO30138.1 nucleotidyltransferase [Blastopirellula marina]PTL42576.1 DNA polymerase Y family protein [Blastopirellula marina]
MNTPASFRPAPARRVLCLWFPEWPAQRLIAARPEATGSLVVIAGENHRGQFVYACNRLARQRGVRRDMPISEARALARPGDQLIVEPWQTAADRQGLEQIAIRCERFSFCVGLEEADPPECLLLDVTGIAHFFGDEQSLARQLRQALVRRRLEGRIAVADTPGAAWAAAHCLAHADRPAVIATCESLDQLPLTGLRFSAATLAKLQRLGVFTIGQLRALDRASLAKRFGAEVLLRLDQWNGQLPELITPCRPLPKFQVERRLEVGITQTEAIERLWKSLLTRLLDLLRPRRFGLHGILFLALQEDRRRWEKSLRLCAATADERHLQELLSLKLANWRLTAPLVEMSLEAIDVAPLAAAQQDWLQGQSQDDARQLSSLINRLSSRLGEEFVSRARLLPDPVPEYAASNVSLSQPGALASTSLPQQFRPLDRPTALFKEPRPVEVLAVMPDGPPTALFWKQTRFDVVQCWGPERIESRWWRQSYVRRDYYWIETTSGSRLWVFQRLQDARWFWQGELF